MRRGAAVGALIAAALIVGCAPADEPAPLRSAIIGGIATSDFPAVNMVIAQVPGSKLASICTGTLVSPHVILTAAHCLDPRLVGATAQVSIFIGVDVSIAKAADFRATRATHIHADFDPDRFQQGGDIGVAIFADALDVPPIAMNRSGLTDSLIAQPATLVGFGKERGDDADGATAGVKRRVETVMGTYTDRVVRFGQPGMTSCEGDSGGPGLMSIDGSTAVVGVVSFGTPTCDREAYDTRVDRYTDWVDGYVEEADPGYLESMGIDPSGRGCSIASPRAERAPGVLALVLVLTAMSRIFATGSAGSRRGRSLSSGSAPPRSM